MSHAADVESLIGLSGARHDKGLKAGRWDCCPASSSAWPRPRRRTAWRRASASSWRRRTATGIVGVKAPSIMLLAFVPMFLIAVAYQQLNRGRARLRHDVHVGRAGVRPAGRLAGRLGHHRRRRHRHGEPRADRGLLHVPAVRPRRPRRRHRSGRTVAGVVWIAVMTYICYRGIEVSARLQYALLGHRGRHPVRVLGHRAGQGLHRQRHARVAHAEHLVADPSDCR